MGYIVAAEVTRLNFFGQIAPFEIMSLVTSAATIFIPSDRLAQKAAVNANIGAGDEAARLVAGEENGCAN